MFQPQTLNAQRLMCYDLTVWPSAIANRSICAPKQAAEYLRARRRGHVYQRADTRDLNNQAKAHRQNKRQANPVQDTPLL